MQCIKCNCDALDAMQTMFNTSKVLPVTWSHADDQANIMLDPTISRTATNKYYTDAAAQVHNSSPQVHLKIRIDLNRQVIGRRRGRGRATCISARGCREARVCRRRALLRGCSPPHFSLNTPHPLETNAWHLYVHDSCCMGMHDPC